MWQHVSAAGGRDQHAHAVILREPVLIAPSPVARRGAAALRSIGAWRFAWAAAQLLAPLRGRRGGVRAGAAPVVSGSPVGSAVMMLTGGIESDDGKNTSGPGVVRGAANADAAVRQCRSDAGDRARRDIRRSAWAPAPARPGNAA